MEGEELQILAYAAQRAYRASRTRPEAVGRVISEHAEADIGLVTGMIEAIDAYEDMKDEPLPDIS